MFLLRCAFWLSVVYASMLFASPFRLLAGGASGSVPAASQPRGESARGQSSQAASGAIVAGLADRAAAGVTELCAGREIACVRDAAKLTALVQTAIDGTPDYVAAAAPAQRPAPMPVPDPRRHGLLTR